MVRVYVDMVADLFHVGHLNLICQAREHGDYLIVGVHSDEDVASYKRDPIISEKDRYQIIKSCKYVDEVIEAAPLIISEEFLKKHRIDVIIHGNDVGDAIKKQHRVPLEKNMIKYVPYTEGVSTTEIISKIVHWGKINEI
jgi:cytidyltransferase-like protein